MPHPDAPGRGVRLESGHQHVAAGLQQKPLVAALGKPVGQVVHHRALADGAEVQLRVLQRGPAAGIHLQAAVVDALQGGGQRGGFRQRAAVIEVPQPGDRQQRRVEGAAGGRGQAQRGAQGLRQPRLELRVAVAVEPGYRTGGVAVVVLGGKFAGGTLHGLPIGTAAVVHGGAHDGGHGGELVLPRALPAACQHGQRHAGGKPRRQRAAERGRAAPGGSAPSAGHRIRPWRGARDWRGRARAVRGSPRTR